MGQKLTFGYHVYAQRVGDQWQGTAWEPTPGQYSGGTLIYDTRLYDDCQKALAAAEWWTVPFKTKVKIMFTLWFGRFLPEIPNVKESY